MEPMPATPGRQHRILIGLASVLVVSLVWLVLLPWIEKQHAVRARIERHERLGVDPSALYYNDLEGMRGWEANVKAARARHPAAFWRFGS